MNKLAINEMTTYRWTFEEDVQRYAQIGVDGIGVWRHKLSDYGEDKGVELIGESGLEVSSLLWAGGFTGSDGRSHKESLQDAREAIQLAAELNASCLIVYSGARAGHTHNHARRLFSGALSNLLPIASEFGVTLAIEPMHPGCAAEWTFLNDLEEAVKLIDSFDSPNVKLAFDTYHVAQTELSCERLAELVDRIALIQLGDAKRPPNGEQNRCRIGAGGIPLDRILHTLTAAGFDGFVEIELIGEDVEATDYFQLLEQSKQAVNDLFSTPNPS